MSPGHSVHLPSSRNLADALTALVQEMAVPVQDQGAALYFDYQGPADFPPEDVDGILRSARCMLGEAVPDAAGGHGAVFMTVHSWPYAEDRCCVTLQVAYTHAPGVDDLMLLTRLSGDPEGLARAGQVPHVPSTAHSGDSPYERREARGEGVVLELMALPRAGGGMSAADAHEDLATAGAWIVDTARQCGGALGARLQRDGWLVRMFADLEEARRFGERHGRAGAPALVVAAEGAVEWDALCRAARTWMSGCTVIYGVGGHGPRGLRNGDVFDGIEIRTLPLSPTDLRGLKERASDVEAARQGLSHARPAGPAGRPRVLVVDDGPINLIVAEEMLHLLGFDADTASDGRSAVEFVELYRPLAILMDLDMPVMGGIEATQRIRRYERHERQGRAPVTIVGTSSHADDDTRDACLRAGMNGVVPKPMAIDALAAALSRA